MRDKRENLTPQIRGDMTLEEVAKIIGISKERVRQIEQMAIKKLRHPKNSRVLRDYINL